MAASAQEAEVAQGKRSANLPLDSSSGTLAVLRGPVASPRFFLNKTQKALSE